MTLIGTTASMPTRIRAASGGRATVPVPGHPLSETFIPNVPQIGDALALLQSLPDSCVPLVFFDPQHRAVLDKVAK
jgi:hypothetical protein